MGFVVATESALRPQASLVPGSLLSLQASLLHGRLNIHYIACSRGTNIAGTLVPTLNFYPLSGWLSNWF